MKSPAQSMATGANVRAELARQGRTQTDLAGVLGITQSQISARIRGRVPWRLEELAAVASYLGTPLTVLIGEAAAA